MPRIGVFGLMASGKSTVSRWFQEWGASLVDGDALGWTVLREPAIVAALVEAFGAAVRSGDGAIDRVAMGRIVFRDPREMDRLNAIVQPRLLDRVREALGSPAPGTVLLDAALLTTWEMEPELDGIVEVRAGDATRAARLVAARGFDAAQALERIQGQRLPPVRNPKRHWMIHNDGDLAALCRQAEAVWKEIARLP